MRRLIPALILALALGAAGASTAAAPARQFQATVLRVSDGDTMVVRTMDYEDLKIRLYGIDAPEKDQEGGAEAGAALRAIQGRLVTIVEMDIDRYGRLVGLVEHEGRSVNLDLAARGLAWHYRQYCRAQPICGQIEAAEAEARAAGRGLWAGRPMPPWEWRRAKRTRPSERPPLSATLTPKPE